MRNLNLEGNKVLFGSALVIMALVLGVVAATPVLAAKGGNDNGRGGAVLYVGEGEFGSAGAGESFNIAGSKFKRDSTAYVGIKYYCCLVPVATDDSGKFTLAHSSLPAGTYTAVAIVSKGKKWVIAAEETFTVE